MQCVALKLIVAIHIMKKISGYARPTQKQNSTFKTVQNPYEGADKQATR